MKSHPIPAGVEVNPNRPWTPDDIAGYSGEVVSAMKVLEPLLRTVQLSGQPLLGISFYLVAGGAFGILYGIMKGAPVNPFSVILHAGLVLYAWSRRRQIFGGDLSWR